LTGTALADNPLNVSENKHSLVREVATPRTN